MFLNIKIRRFYNSFSTNLYHTVTFSEVFTNFESFIPVFKLYSNLTFTLLFRGFKLCSNLKLFHQEILNLRTFKIHGYPCNFIDVCIKRFLNNVFIDKKVYDLAPKKELVCVLPFIGKNPDS